MFKNILCMTALAAVVAPAFAAEWMTDFEAAKAKAAQENKAVLVDFTGSDWCGYCIKLRKEVLDKPAFEEYAADKFVLVEVDMPRQKQLPPALAEQNQKLCAQYGIQGFPTLLVLTPEGKVMGGFSGYRPTQAEAAKPLDAALATMELYKKAQSADGDEKAQRLLEAYQSIPESMRATSGLIDEVAAADTNNVTGAKDQAKDEAQAKEIKDKLRACGNDVEKIKAVIVEALETATPANKAKLQETLADIENMIVSREVEKALQESPAKALEMVAEKLKTAPESQKMMLLSAKFEITLLLAETEADLENAKAVAAELKAVLPPHMAQSFQDFIDKQFANPAALLEKMKEEREEMKGAH